MQSQVRFRRWKIAVGKTMTQTSVESEIQANSGKHNISAAELLLHAYRRSGKSFARLTRDFLRLNKGRGKIRLQEYVTWQLYDDRFSKEDKDRFISNGLHWPITSECSDRTWDAATEDKFLAEAIFRAGGVATPETVAVIDKSLRHYGTTEKLSNADGLRGFLTQSGTLPLFGKVLRGICSFGAFHVTGADETHIHLKNQNPVTYHSFLDELIGDTPYLLQRIVENHSAIDDVCSATATVRLVSMVRREDVYFPLAVLKLPGAGNIADAFWRAGNVCCNIDPANGQILNITTNDGPDLVRNESHPETGRNLIGEFLPDWDRLIETSTRAARLFAPVRYQSLDVALTENGPVVIEINTGGGFDLPQNASGVGMLTDEVRDFFRACGSRRV
jgi:putative polysaccharide biosynthesis protein